MSLLCALFVLVNAGAFAAGAKDPKEMDSAHQYINPYSKTAGDSFKNLPAAKKGGAIYSGVSGNFKYLNPMLTQDENGMNVLSFIFAKLYDYDRETGEFFPCIAEKLEISKDHKEMVYTLRKEATWEDGSPITTDDVEFSFKILMDGKNDNAPKRSYFEKYTFEKVNQYVFKFKNDKPSINTLPETNSDFYVIQKKQFEHEASFTNSKGIMQPIGSGPYKLKSYLPDQKIELERNKEWWGFKLPYYKGVHNFDSIIFRIIPDTTLAYEKFVKGEIDVIAMNAEMFGSKVKGIDKDKFGSSPNSGKEMWAAKQVTKAPPVWNYIGWNLKRPYFASKKTRQALAHLIDYDQIIKTLFYGLYERCVSPFGSSTLDAAPDQKSKAFKFDPSLGIAMLKEDGWSDTDDDGILDKVIDGKKVKFEFTLRYNSDNPVRAKTAQMIKEQFKKAGIVVNVQALEWVTYINEIDNRTSDAFILSWAKGSVNANVRQLWDTKSYENKGSNFVAYSNPEVDKLSDLAESELNGAKRHKLLQKIGAIIYDDQPYAFIAEIPGFLAAYHTKLKAKKWMMSYDDQPAIWLYSAE